MCCSIFYYVLLVPLWAFDLFFGINFLKDGRIVSFLIDWRIMYLFTPIDHVLQYFARRGEIKKQYVCFILPFLSLILPALLEKRRISTGDFIFSIFLLIELKLELKLFYWFNYILALIARFFIFYKLILNETPFRSERSSGIGST